LKVVNSYNFLFQFLYKTVICFASTHIISPSSSAKSTYQDHSQITLSIPVPIIGAFGLTKGTACLIIFDPISALVASLCSKNGIREVSTDTICFGEISIWVISLT
jgi:hypothetical protein